MNQNYVLGFIIVVLIAVLLIKFYQTKRRRITPAVPAEEYSLDVWRKIYDKSTPLSEQKKSARENWDHHALLEVLSAQSIPEIQRAKHRARASSLAEQAAKQVHEELSMRQLHKAGNNFEALKKVAEEAPKGEAKTQAIDKMRLVVILESLSKTNRAA